MTVTEAVAARRTIFKFKPDPVPNDVIEEDLWVSEFLRPTTNLPNRGDSP